MKKLFFLLAVIIATTISAAAQNRTVQGVVVDAENDEPLAGASVLPVGSGSGVATNADGQFSLSVPASAKQLTVSYVGYTSQTVAISDNMTIKLAPSSTVLEQLVVTGYGSAKKLGSVVGSVSVVGEAAIENTPASNFVDALQGQVAGLSISSNTGEPASTPTSVRIRGVNSLEASNTPLYILDGAPVTSSVFTSLNTNDIENVTVLKDASATAIYGSRAANGVIVITSKKGKYGEKANVTLRASIGWSEMVQSNLDMMNSKEYAQYRQILYDNYGIANLTQQQLDLINVYGIDTDWRKEVIKDNAPTWSVEAAVQGGTERTSYYVSLGHYDQDGLISRSEFRRQTLRSSIDSKVNDWLKVGLQLSLGVEHYATNGIASQGTNVNYLNNPIFQAFYLLPFDSPNYYTFDENGNIQYGQRAEWYQYSKVADANFENNQRHGLNSQVSLNGMLYEQINPVKGLTLRAQQAVNAYDSRGTSSFHSLENYVTPMGSMTSFQMVGTDGRFRSESFSRYYAFTYTNTAEYAITLGGVHDITALLGQESIITRQNGFGVSTVGQPNNIQMLLTNGTEITLDDVSQSISEYVINSYFLNVDYAFDNRYFFNASVRRDGSSKFAPNHRWATFFAVGAMWNAKNETFLNNVTWLDDLRLRINYGTTGNSGINPYQYSGVLATGTNYNGESTLGLARQSNHDLTWETVRKFTVGVGYGFLNRIYGNVDFYVNTTKDMLMIIPYSCTTGWTEGMANIGSLRNTGVDLEIGAHIFQNKDWYVGARFNMAYNNNEIVELFNGEDEYVLTDYNMVYKVGENPMQLNTVLFAGVDPQDGKQMWYDINGNITKEYNEERDRVNTGKSFMAPWTGGFGFDVRWKGISLHTDFNWAAEKYILNYGTIMLQNGPQSINGQRNQTKEMLNIWTHPGQVTNIPALTEQIQTDSRFLENSSYCRMKNITLAYNFPKNLVSKLGLTDLQLHFTGRNLLTFCSDDYTGNDPEYESNLVTLNYPNTRQYEFGIQVSF